MGSRSRGVVIWLNQVRRWQMPKLIATDCRHESLVRAINNVCDFWKCDIDACMGGMND